MSLAIIGRKSRRILSLVVGIVVLTSVSYYTGYHKTVLSSIKLPDSLTPQSMKHSEYQRANATFVTLCRESELGQALEAVASWEDRLNAKYHYDWVFLNDKPFSEHFKASISNLVTGKAKFGVLPPDMWQVPDHIDPELFKIGLANMKEEKVMYSDSVPYRQMCRFYSGKFYDHELIKPYKYFWRVDPDTEMFCDIEYDVFKKMQDEELQYGFVISFKEAMKTVPSLWNTVKAFLEKNPTYLHPNAAKSFVTDESMNEYNSCHFWTNFEIGDMDFFRSKEYRAFFDFLDQTGGFFYERWGDAPVHSLAVALLMDKSKIHYFDDVGYIHTGVSHVPEDYVNRGYKCSKLADKNFDWMRHSCLREANIALNLHLSPPPKKSKDVDMEKADYEKLKKWYREYFPKIKAQKEKWLKDKDKKQKEQWEKDQAKKGQPSKDPVDTDQVNKDQEKKDQEKKDQEKKDQEKKDQEKKDQEKKDQEKKNQAKKDQEKKDQAKKDQEKKDQEKKDQANKDQANKNQVDKNQDNKDQANKDQANKDQANKDQVNKDQAKKDQEKKDQEKKDQEKKDQEKKDQAKKDQANKDQANKDQNNKS